ncbi:hypothetical protein MMC10_008031 [Thelotrema lepadinum]|nr:hypothetical protein [Thelotrema lepadinum]
MSSSISFSSVISALFSLCLFPFLVTLTFIFVPLAIFTTGLAVSALTFRAALVYVELATALIWERLGSRGGLSESKGCKDATKTATNDKVETQISRIRADPSKHSHISRRLGIHRKQDSGRTLLAPKNDSTLLRDYEGVGGWMSYEDPSTRQSTDQGATDDSHLQWLRINSRLELQNADPITSIQPKTPQRELSHSTKRHQRSATAEPFGPLTALRPKSNIDLSSVNLHRSERPKSMILLDSSSDQHLPPGEDLHAQRRNSKSLGPHQRMGQDLEECDEDEHTKSSVWEQEKMRRQSNDSGSSRDGYTDGLTMLNR